VCESTGTAVRDRRYKAIFSQLLTFFSTCETDMYPPWQEPAQSEDSMILRLTTLHENARSALECPLVDGLDAALQFAGSYRPASQARPFRKAATRHEPQDEGGVKPPHSKVSLTHDFPIFFPSGLYVIACPCHDDRSKLKVKERTGNVIENKGALWKALAGTGNVAENKGGYALKSRMLMKIKVLSMCQESADGFR
jgi:hypothetical protein